MRRVFILYRTLMFAHGLKSLLSQAPGLTIVGLGPQEEGVWEDVLRLAPDTIILEVGEDTPLWRLVDAEPEARVIAISLNHNRVRIYERLSVQGKGLEAVISAIGQASGEPGSKRANGKRGRGPKGAS